MYIYMYMSCISFLYDSILVQKMDPSAGPVDSGGFDASLKKNDPLRVHKSLYAKGVFVMACEGGDNNNNNNNNNNNSSSNGGGSYNGGVQSAGAGGAGSSRHAQSQTQTYDEIIALCEDPIMRTVGTGGMVGGTCDVCG